MVSRVLKKKRVDVDVYTLALERVEHAYKLFDHLSVSFSGGKDSTACLNVTLEVARSLGKLPVHAFFFDEEAIPYETEEYVRRCVRDKEIVLDWYCLPVKHRNACSRRDPWWWPWAPEDEAKWVRSLPSEGLVEKDVPRYPTEVEARLTIPDAVGLLFPPEKYGRVGMVMGIRADESMTRYRACARRPKDNYLIPWNDGTSEGNLTKVYPVYDWSTADVWTAPGLKGWDYNVGYDHMEQAGIRHSDQRCAPPYGEEPMRGLWQFSVCFPDIWDKMSVRVPGANTAVRYSRTSLYSYGKQPEKPDDVSWETFLEQHLMKWGARERAQIAGRIKQWIGWHYNKTNDPILEEMHPHTAMCWSFLLSVVVRGDFKGRKQPMATSDEDVMATRAVKYYVALDKHHEIRRAQA